MKIPWKAGHFLQAEESSGPRTAPVRTLQAQAGTFRTCSRGPWAFPLNRSQCHTPKTSLTVLKGEETEYTPSSSGKLRAIGETFTCRDKNSLPSIHMLQEADTWFSLCRESSDASILNAIVQSHLPKTSACSTIRCHNFRSNKFYRLCEHYLQERVQKGIHSSPHFPLNQDIWQWVFGDCFKIISNCLKSSKLTFETSTLYIDTWSRCHKFALHVRLILAVYWRSRDPSQAASRYLLLQSTCSLFLNCYPICTPKSLSHVVSLRKFTGQWPYTVCTNSNH